MDAPKGRYRVEEREGRLVVIDTAAEAPVGSDAPAPPGRPGRPAGPVAGPGPSLFDLLGRLLLNLVVSGWDEQGRAIIAWRWEENGRARRWDAALAPGQQRRLGRALLGFAAFPLVILLSIFGSFAWLWLIALALPAALWAAWSVVRLQRETGAR